MIVLALLLKCSTASVIIKSAEACVDDSDCALNSSSSSYREVFLSIRILDLALLLLLIYFLQMNPCGCSISIVAFVA